MLKFNRKNEKQRKHLFKYEYNHLVKNIMTRFFIKYGNIHIRKHLLSLYDKQIFSMYSKTRNVCIVTGRTRSVYRLFKLARSKIREYVNCGYFVGVSKASW